MTSSISFTGINFEVCMYCKHMNYAFSRDDIGHGCNIRKIDDKFCRIIHPKGCEKFEPSGLPTHPLVLEDLCKNNPLSAQVPSNELALETSYKFEDKMIALKINKEVRYSEIL